ncbi:MAG TPA: DUF4172 domain-containing protein [Deltaproteobacteria bacterium]|nr:DUF4172 domain-containing protein [Deltaproteobacteria bacterium]
MKYIWQKKGWPKLLWQNDKLVAQLGKVRLCQGGLMNRVKSLGFNVKEARSEVLVHETIKTSAIEGTIVDPAAVRSSVAKRLGLPSAGLTTPDRYIDGMIDVLLDATTRHQAPLTTQRLKGWQAALFPTGFSGIHPVRVGKWRGAQPMQILSGPLGRERIHYEAPPHNRIDKEMHQFLSWWAKSLGKMDGLIRAGVAHFYFITIHPFEDGNGRMARAITECALAQDEQKEERFYSLSSQIMAERKAYYDVLESSQKGTNDITSWLQWFLGCLERALQNSEKIISRVLAKNDFWHHFANVSINDRQRKVINRLLDAGTGGFEGGLTTRKYVGLTKASRATAFREINDLLEKGILKKNEGAGRNVSYQLRFEKKDVP